MERRRRYSGCVASSTLMARSALVGSLKVTIQAECSSSRFSSVSIFSALSASWIGLQIRFLAEVRLGVDGEIGASQNLHHARIAKPALQAPPSELELVELHQEIQQLPAFQHRLICQLDFQILGGAAQNLARELFVVLDVLLALAAS